MNSISTNFAPELRVIPPDAQLDTKRAITISFWIVIILGIPFWWKSTSLERVPLPTSQIAYWQDRLDCPLQETVSIHLRVGTDGLNNVLDDVVNELKGIETGCIQLNVNNPAIVDSYEIVLVDKFDSVNSSSNSKSSAILVDKDALYVKEAISRSISTMFGLQKAKDSRGMKFAPTYKLAFSLLNQDSSEGDAVLDWNVDELLQEYISPLLTELSPLHTFTIETGIQYYAPLSIELQVTEEGSFVESDVLREFVNSAGWNVASSVTLDPVLHFILYIPSRTIRPMQIRTSKGQISKSNAFITPQWGAVVIHNSIANQPINLSRSFQIFNLQLSKLLNIPAIPSNVLPTASVLEPWQLDLLIRNRLSQAAKETIGNLAAIVKLSDDIPNMRVGREVLQDINSAIKELNIAQSTLPDTKSALLHAARAHTLSTSAYFNPTMLALLYFPDEHKYAIYTPLFGPVLVPLLIGLVRETKRWLADRKKKRLEKSKME